MVSVSNAECAAVVASYLRENNYMRTLEAFESESPYLADNLQSEAGAGVSASAVKSLSCILGEYVALVSMRQGLRRVAATLGALHEDVARKAQAGCAAVGAAGMPAPQPQQGQQQDVHAERAGMGAHAGTSRAGAPGAASGPRVEQQQGEDEADVDEADAGGHDGDAGVAMGVGTLSPARSPGGHQRKRRRPRKRAATSAAAALNFSGGDAGGDDAGTARAAADQLLTQPFSEDAFRALLANEGFAQRLAAHISQSVGTSAAAGGGRVQRHADHAPAPAAPAAVAAAAAPFSNSPAGRALAAGVANVADVLGDPLDISALLADDSFVALLGDTVQAAGK